MAEKCPECYSTNPRITPMLNPEECLRNHIQYRCSICGRLICIGVKGAKKARCLMPFDSIDKAVLYLKAAEIMMGKECAIYEYTDKFDKKRYRTFAYEKDWDKFVKSKKNIKPTENNPVYKSKEYNPISESQIIFLKESEVEKYLKEKYSISEPR